MLYYSTFSVQPSALGSYDWKVRWDWDVFQRCLGVAFLSLMAYWTLNSSPLAWMGLWASPLLLQLWLTVALALAVLKSAARLKPEGRSVLITGCDTGFGLILAKHLHSLGFQVFAGCLLKNLGGPGAKELEALDPGRVHVLQLDVTKDEDWKEALQYVTKVRHGKD